MQSSYYWLTKDPRGADLAALRRGLGRAAGDVPGMWRFYQHMNADGSVTGMLRAEHAALSLYAMHQQSIGHSMHQPEIGLGTALFALRHAEGVNPDAVDQRFAAAATATSLAELVGHLRGLIHRLRGVNTGTGRGQGLDYSLLVRDLAGWQRPGGTIRVRRRWGGQYFSLASAKAPHSQPSNDQPSSPAVKETP
ncbi:MAG: type I-E CRISPR-associated protein Cse2/CasB [Dactylosporangium sp.]|nr:type I-E CRISPR-associated protein Cse2/CasB [Dactylosporangium sp.]